MYILTADHQSIRPFNPASGLLEQAECSSTVFLLQLLCYQQHSAVKCSLQERHRIILSQTISTWNGEGSCDYSHTHLDDAVASSSIHNNIRLSNLDDITIQHLQRFIFIHILAARMKSDAVIDEAVASCILLDLSALPLRDHIAFEDVSRARDWMVMWRSCHARWIFQKH